MPTLERPLKEGSVRTYQAKVGLGFTDILASEVDADLDTIYAAWNSGVSNIVAQSVRGTPSAGGTAREIAKASIWAGDDLIDFSIPTAKLAAGAVDGYKLGSPLAARVGQATTPNVPTGTFFAIGFTTLAGYGYAAQLWSAAAPTRFTIPSAVGGYYLVGGSIELGPVSTGSRIVLLVRADGTTEFARAECPLTGNSVRAVSVAVGGVFASGQYLELVAWHDAGAALPFTSFPPNFWIARLG
jgi:hypothetical protein